MTPRYNSLASVLPVVGTIIVLITAYQMAAYIVLPVDLLSFAESPFVNDILKLRLGTPLYTPPQDNNAYPYTPGAQILTYVLAAAFGHGDSIPFYRVIQLSYVVFASAVATSVCYLLARKFVPHDAFRHRFLWVSVWFPFLLLVAIDPRFNLYNHSLHNDGLALLVSVCAFWLMVKHAMAPQVRLLRLMAVLPALGFLVKQNLLMWIGIFSLYLLVAGNVRWQQFVLFLLSSIICAFTVIGICSLLWGEHFLYWVFNALGAKQVSVLRSILHLFQAGIYAIMGLFGGWVLVLRDGSRTAAALWLSWLLVFGIEVYTSGIGFQANHLGPGVMLGACWFLSALVKVWPTADSARTWWQYRAQESVAVCMVILLFGALGLIREPRNPVPPDFFRYVTDIEKEFQGLPAEAVLMDTGTWVYLRENTLMRDRSAPVSLHVGKNQPEINHAVLSATIRRIEQKTYAKILARQLDTGHTWYDFQDRGSGVKAAILTNYHEIRRIPGVQGITHWWPEHLVADILVLVPNQDQGELSAAPRSAQPSYDIVEDSAGGWRSRKNR